jgi:hypothetical protein
VEPAGISPMIYSFDSQIRDPRFSQAIRLSYIISSNMGARGASQCRDRRNSAISVQGAFAQGSAKIQRVRLCLQ